MVGVLEGMHPEARSSTFQFGEELEFFFPHQWIRCKIRCRLLQLLQTGHNWITFTSVGLCLDHSFAKPNWSWTGFFNSITRLLLALQAVGTSGRKSLLHFQHLRMHTAPHLELALIPNYSLQDPSLTQTNKNLTEPCQTPPTLIDRLPVRKVV